MTDPSTDHAAEAQRQIDAAARQRSQRLSLALPQMASVPPLGKLASHLLSLDLKGYGALTDVRVLSDLKNLQALSLSGYALTDLEGIENFQNLRSLSLSGCSALTSVQGLTGLTNLQSLDLSYCSGLTDLQCLSELENLRELRLCSCNGLTNVQGLAGLRSLQLLDLTLCRALTDVRGLSGLSELRSLKLGSCRALMGVQGLAGLENLRELDLSTCSALRDLQGLTGLPNLESLKLVGCSHLSDVGSVAGLTTLRSLDLTGCPALTNVRGIDRLTNLQLLQLNCCEALTDVTVLADLKNLRSLGLTECVGLTDLRCLATLTELRDLHLMSAAPLDCEPGALPLSAWHHLEDLCANNLRGAPHELGSANGLDNALPRIRAWQEDLIQGEAPNSVLKVFLLGNGSVGKTQLCRRLRGDNFDPTVLSTHGIFLDRFPLIPPSGDRPEIEANVWDFGGQDIYLGTHALFLDERAIYVIAWTPKYEDSNEFEEDGILLRNRPLAYWIEYVHSLAGSQVPIIVVQTQCDREMDVRPPPLPAHRFERLSTVASSSHPDGIGIDQLQLALNSAARYQWERYGKVRLPASWVSVRDTLHQRKDEKTLLVEDFNALCRSLHTNALPNVVLEYLHRSGQVFWREGAFGNQVVIDQAWAFTGIYALLERNRFVHSIRERGGWFTREDLAERVWRSYTEQEQTLFLSMMKQCQACFEVVPGKYVAPVHLPAPTVVEETAQACWQHAAPEVIVELRYDFLHEGVVRAMLCAIGRQAGVNAVYWAYGVCFYDIDRRSKVRITATLPESTSDALGRGGRIQLEAVGQEAVGLAEHLVRSVEQLRIGRAPDVIWHRQQPSANNRVDPEEKPFSVSAGLPDDASAFLREYFAKWTSGIIVVNVEGDFVVNDQKNQMTISNSPGASVAQGGSVVSENTATVTLTPAAVQPTEWPREPALDGLRPHHPPLSSVEAYPVYVSYAWEAATIAWVDELEKTLPSHFRLHRDKNEVRPGDWISKFMQEVGRAQQVIVVLSSKYLQSPYCMRELLYLHDHSLGERDELMGRIVPVVMEDLKTAEGTDRLAYVIFWQQKHDALQKMIEKAGFAAAGGAARDDLLLMKDFIHRTDCLLKWVSDVLVPRPRPDDPKSAIKAVIEVLDRRRENLD